MMFSCSVASELSNYDSGQSVHFCHLLGDVTRGNPWVVQAEMEGCKVWKKFVGAWGIQSSWIFHRTSVYEGKYDVKLSVTELIKISWKWRKRSNGRLWKMQMWSDSICLYQRWSEYNTNVLEYEYDYFEHAWVRVRVLRKQIYSSTITLQYTRVRVRVRLL